MNENIFEPAEAENTNLEAESVEFVDADAEQTVQTVPLPSDPDISEEEIESEPTPADATEEPAKKRPRSTRRRKAAEATAALDADAESPEPAEPAPTSAPRRRAPSRVIKSLTGHLEATTAEKESNEAWIDIMASMRSKRILKGNVFGVERWNKMPCAIVMYRGVKVIIPAKEFLLELPDGDDLNDRSDKFLSKTYSYMQNRLGSEIEFMIVGWVEKSEQLVAGSRKAALSVKQREYFMRKKSRDSNEFLLNEGQRVEVRIASALRFGLVVEVGGIDVFVPSEEVTWNRKRDITSDFYAGQKVVAVITELDRSDPNNIKVAVSIKRATPDPFEKATKILSTDRNSKYIGQVTMIAPHGVYVQLDSQLEVRCNHPRDKSYITVGSRVAVRVYEINEERREIRGEIIWNGGLHTLV